MSDLNACLSSDRVWRWCGHRRVSMMQNVVDERREPEWDVRRTSPSALAVGVLVMGAVVTGCVILIPQVRFGYRSAGGHIAVETAAVLIALLVAMLALGRFRWNAELADLLLTATFMLLALVNLVFTAIPAVVSDLPNSAATWGAVGGRAVGRPALLAAAAVSPRRSVCGGGAVWSGCWVLHRRRLAGGGWARGGRGIAAPNRSTRGLSPTRSARPGSDGSSTGRRCTAGSCGLLTRSLRSAISGGREESSILCTRVWASGRCWRAGPRPNYALFPSLFSDWIYLGDLFRARRLSRVPPSRRSARSAATGRDSPGSPILEERQRLARDLHDGLAQELAFIPCATSHPPSRGR